MKKMACTVFMAAFVIHLVSLGHSALRPRVKVMMERLDLITDIVTSYALSDYEKAGTLSDRLASNAREAGDGATNHNEKELSYELERKARALADSTKIDIGKFTIKKQIAISIGEVLVVCNDCHVTMRD